MLRINEIFYSIQGESSFAGLATVFVRLTGCNLRCSYCDSKYSYTAGEFFSIDHLLKKVADFHCQLVCITGGEPLLQKESLSLMKSLCDLGYTVSLETSGSKSIQQVDSRVKIILDVKTPDSGAENSFLLNNLLWATPQSEFKFVLCSDSDFEWSENFCRQYDIFKKYVVLYSPSFGSINPLWLAERILQKKSSARLHLQQHKYIWSPEVRSV